MQFSPDNITKLNTKKTEAAQFYETISSFYKKDKTLSGTTKGSFGLIFETGVTIQISYDVPVYESNNDKSFVESRDIVNAIQKKLQQIIIVDQPFSLMSAGKSVDLGFWINPKTDGLQEGLLHYISQ